METKKVKKKHGNVTFLEKWNKPISTFIKAGRLEEMIIFSGKVHVFILSGIEPNFTDDLSLGLWNAIETEVRAQRKEYKALMSRRENGEKGGRPRTRQEEPTAGDPGTASPPEYDGRGRGRRRATAPASKEEPPMTSTPTATPAPLTPPEQTTPPPPESPEEVTEKAKELGATRVNCKKFYHHYAGKQWRATDGQPLDWINKLLEWEAKEEEQKGQPQTATPPRAAPSPSPPATSTHSARMEEERERRHMEYEERERNAVKPSDYIRNLGYDPEKVTMMQVMNPEWRERNPPPKAV